MTVPAEPRLSASSVVVQDAVAGNRSAFTELVATYHADMIRLAMVVAGDSDMANDAVQAAWGIAWRKIGQLRDPERVRSWLLTIAANEARQALRRRSHLVAMPEAMSDTPGPPDGNPIDAIELARAMATLRPEDRRLVGLRYVSGFNATELAQMLGISPEGVRSRLKRILARLRTELDE
jgi:RNA polymerase sigma-70 factor (ECF subfamily)